MTETGQMPPGGLGSIGSSLAELKPQVKLDATDVELLRLLSQDGRITHKRLAATLGMSSPAIAERIARLTQKGVIDGYTANINWETLGYATIVYLSVIISPGADRGEVIEALAAARGVEEVTLLTGSADVLVKMRVRDNYHLRQILTESIWRIDGIAKTETSLGLGQARGLKPAARLIAEIALDMTSSAED